MKNNNKKILENQNLTLLLDIQKKRLGAFLIKHRD